MAGRGTDIVLGGNVEKQCELIEASPEIPPDEKAARIAQLRSEWQQLHDLVIREGGLHIVGTERHESRRVDNQLRGRSGRQGDPGSSRFYLSLEDDLLRIFGSQRIQKIMERLGMEEGEPIEHKLVNRAIATAQKRVETHNFEIRKHLLEYDDVMNKQREIIYGMRRQILDGESQAETIEEWIEETAVVAVEPYAAEDAHPEDWDLAGLAEGVNQQFGFRLRLPSVDDAPTRGALDEIVLEAVRERYAERERELGVDLLRALERHEMLIVIDQ